MTRKDFAAIANVLRYAEQHSNEQEEKTVRFVTARMCDELALSHPSFDPLRFLEAATREPDAALNLCGSRAYAKAVAQ